MSLQRTRTTLISFVLLAAIVTAAFVGAANAAVVPLRSGTVVSKMDADVFTFVKAVDDAGKQFWVLTSICTIGEKGKIAVLAGAHHDKLKTAQYGILEDVYVGDQVRIGDAEVVGFGTHKLPAGCVVME